MDEKQTDGQRLVKNWLTQIDAACEKDKEWHSRGDKIIEKYRNEEGTGRNQSKDNQYNILASNTETLKSALYPYTPAPIARQRSSVDDKPSREAANILERVLAFSIDEYDFDNMARSVLLDALLAGRGNARVRYIPTMIDAPVQVPLTEATDDKDAEEVQIDQETGEYSKTVLQQEVGYEEVQCEYFGWKDVVLIGGKRWDKLTAVAFRGEYSRDELVDQFGEEKGNAVKLTLKEEQKQGVAESGKPDKAVVWEIWDKKNMERLYITDGYQADVLKTEPDPLKLKNFFPIPRPMAFITTNETLVPVPLYKLYEDQALELNEITRRIQRLTKKLQAKGIYNAVVKEVASVYQGEDNDYIPVTLPSDIDLSKMVIHWPIEQIAKVLAGLYQQREQIKQIIYEVTGISDIVRGASQASETATAQRIKGQYASIRLDELRNEVKRFVRDLMDMKAEVAANLFSPETLLQVSGIKLPTAQEKEQASMQMQEGAMMAQQAALAGMAPPPVDPVLQEIMAKPTQEEVMGIIKQSLPRRYRIDVETEDTSAPDIDADRGRAIELLGGLGQFAQAAPAVAAIFGQDFVKEIVAVTIRKFHTGKQIDDAVDMAMALPPQQLMMPQQAPAQGVPANA